MWVIFFDGFGNADIHHTIHGLRWAPWGDLHFTQSIYINSFIETAYGTRVLNGSGIWSFRPETEEQMFAKPYKWKFKGFNKIKALIYSIN